MKGPSRFVKVRCPDCTGRGRIRIRRGELKSSTLRHDPTCPLLRRREVLGLGPSLVLVPFQRTDA